MRIRYYSATNTGTVDYLRAANLHSLMLELLQQSGRTKAELVCATELSMSTVSDCINRLTRSALLTTSERSTSSGGRKPVRYAIREDYAAMLGLYMNEEGVHVSLCDMAYGERERFFFPATDRSPVYTLYEAVRRGQELAGSQRIVSIGIGVEGTSDPDRGIVVESEAFGWSQVHLRELVERRFGLPVYVDHPARALCIHELLFSGSDMLTDFAFLLSRFPHQAVLVLDRQGVCGPSFRCGKIEDPQELVTCMRVTDTPVLITDMEIDSGHLRRAMPISRGISPEQACCLMAEVRWFWSIYDLSRE